MNSAQICDCCNRYISCVKYKYIKTITLGMRFEGDPWVISKEILLCDKCRWSYSTVKNTETKDSFIYKYMDSTNNERLYSLWMKGDIPLIVFPVVILFFGIFGLYVHLT